MGRSVSLANLKTMSERQQARTLSKLVQATRALPNGEIKVLEHRITSYEETWGFTSEEMKSRLLSGELSETAEICEWLMLVRMRGDLVALSALPR